MHIIRAIHSGAKTILAYFHYICKGQRPFSPNTNWDSPELKKMAQLDEEQVRFLKQYQDLVRQNGGYPQASPRQVAIATYAKTAQPTECRLSV